MRRKIVSLLLAVSMLLVLMPDTAMAARLERKPATIRKAADQMEIDGAAREDREADISTDTDKAADIFLEGSGSETDPYRVGDAEQMRAFADMVNGVGGTANAGICAVLTQDIDLSDVCGTGVGSWRPIGTKACPYTGIFDGGSFAVRGLYYNDPDASYAGLFGSNSGVIKNLGVADGDVTADEYTGSVCGFNSGIITGCYNAASVKGGRYTGGVCGYNDDSGSVNICYNTGAVSGSKYVGGICGYNRNMAVNCYNMGTVNGGSTSVGGICGYNKKQVSDCYNTGAVSSKGTNYVGSICGYNHTESIFLNCYYLITGTEKDNCGVAKTQEQFATGEVCWLLNGEKSEDVVWYQTCGEGFPAFGGKTVYQVQSYRGSGDTKELAASYTNDRNKRGMTSYTATAVEENSSGHFEVDSDTTADGHVYQGPEWKWKEYKEAAAVFICQECGEEITLEATVEKKTTEATCAAEGKTVYTASVVREGKTYRDTKTVKIAKTGHQTFEAVNRTAATCEKAGYKMDCWVCPVCGKYFEDQAGTVGLSKNEVVEPALGHRYGDNREWDWADDNSSAILIFKCDNDCGETITKNGRVQSESTASCTKPGKTVYTATVQYNGEKYEDTRIFDGQTLPHDYSGEPEWEWSDDYFSAIASFSCSYGCGVSESVSVESTSSESKGTNCSDPGQITYTAVVEYKGKSYTDTKKVEIPGMHTLEHVPAKEATCKVQGNTEYWTCSVCGQCFSDAAGTVIVAVETTIISKTAHVFQLVKDDIYRCTVCDGIYVIMEKENGTKSFYSLEEGVAIDEEGESDNLADWFGKDEKQDGEEAHGELPAESIVEGEQKKSWHWSADGQAGQSGQENQGEQAGQIGQENQEEQSEQIGQEDQEEQAGQIGQENQEEQSEQIGQEDQEEQAEQIGQENQEEQIDQEEQIGQNELIGNESGEHTADTLEENAHYGVVYPADEENKADSMISDTWEGSAVSLRAESAVSGEVQEERMEWPFWASVAALAVFTGMILVFILHRKET